MSKLLVGPIVAENKMQVHRIYNLDVEENQGMDTSIGVIVDTEATPPEAKIGKGYAWFVNNQTKVQFFEEVDVPLSPEDKVAQLESADLDNKELIASLYEMILGGM